MLSSTVTVVNARAVAESRGIEIIESKSSRPRDFANLLSIKLHTSDGRVIERELQAGRDTAEWAHDRADVQARVQHERANVIENWAAGDYTGHRYLARLPFDRAEITRVEMQYQLNENARTAEVTISHPRFLEFLRPGVSKGVAVSWLARRAGVPLSAVLAIGDQFNDLEMIEGAGHGAAMPHAPRPVLAAARYVAPSLAEEGAAQLIERLVLAAPAAAARAAEELAAERHASIASAELSATA